MEQDRKIDIKGWLSPLAAIASIFVIIYYNNTNDFKRLEEQINEIKIEIAELHACMKRREDFEKTVDAFQKKMNDFQKTTTMNITDLRVDVAKLYYGGAKNK